MKAAEGGHPLAMQQVSEMYRDGVGVEKNEELSAYWLQRAEEQKRKMNLRKSSKKSKKRKMILRQHLKKFEVYQQGYD